MSPTILALATAVPVHSFQQNEIVEKMIELFSTEKEKADRFRQLYQNSAIQTRYSVIEDFKKDRSEWIFWGPNFPQTNPGMHQRNDLYKKEAPKLAIEAASKALELWGQDPSLITHVISVSCTGVIAPGIEFDLMNALKLKRSVNRLGINFMGCFGAFKGLAVAQSFAKENPKNRILLVCTELCSLHLQAEQNPDNILANSLFSDGSAAVIVGSHPKGQEAPLWTIEKQESFALEDTLDKMSWEAGDNGFKMKLSHTVPVLLGRQIASFTHSFLGSEIASTDCDWAVHPGGKSILQSIEKALVLNPNQAEASWNTLANYGNMSSSTFLFVLEQLLKQKNQKKWVVGLGFGPGLSVESILLQKSS